MKRYFLFLLSAIVGLIGLSAVLLACGVNTDIATSHSVLALLGWLVFVVAGSAVCKRLAIKWGVRPGVGALMNIVALLTLFLGFSIPIQLGKVVFGALGIIVLTLICLIRYLIHLWMAWLKAP